MTAMGMVQAARCCLRDTTREASRAAHHRKLSHDYKNSVYDDTAMTKPIAHRVLCIAFVAFAALYVAKYSARQTRTTAPVAPAAPATLSDEEKTEITAHKGSQQKSLELLFEYTKFHIGLYLLLTSAYVTVAAAKFGEKPLLPLSTEFVPSAVLAFIFAGLAGGVIASSLTQTDARSAQEFLKSRIGPWDIKAFQFRARVWTWIEHTTFWYGLAMALCSFLL